MNDMTYIATVPTFQVNYLVYEGRELEESAWCSIPFNEEGIGSMYLMLAATTLYFLVPMVTVTFIYIRWELLSIFFVHYYSHDVSIIAIIE